MLTEEIKVIGQKPNQKAFVHFHQYEDGWAISHITINEYHTEKVVNSETRDKSGPLFPTKVDLMEAANRLVMFFLSNE